MKVYISYVCVQCMYSVGTNTLCKCVNVQPQSVCVVVFCVLYSQCPQLGHVVEAGQGDEGDVVVVEGAGRRNREREGKKGGEKRKTDC